MDSLSIKYNVNVCGYLLEGSVITKIYYRETKYGPEKLLLFINRLHSSSFILQTETLQEKINMPHMNSLHAQAAKAIVLEFKERMELLLSGKKMEEVISSGYPELDKIIGGFQPGQLYVVGARPSVGKTALMINWIRNIITKVKDSKNILIFSIDSNAQSLLQRLVSCMSAIPLEKITQGNLSKEEWEMIQNFTLTEISNAALVIEENTICSIATIREKCLQLKAENNLGIVFIDYLQLISPVKGRYRDEEITEIMRGLKDLSKDAVVPIVLFSQLSRAIENRHDSKTPRLSDLRDSGTIEQLADVVMFIYRPEYYEITSNEYVQHSKGETHLKIAKNKMGALETIQLKSDLQIQRFYEIENLEYFTEKKDWTNFFEKQKNNFSDNNQIPF